jgi:hypothetical protein
MPRTRSNVIPLPVAPATKPKGDSRPLLTGCEEDLVRIRELAPLIENAEAEVKASRQSIEDAARDLAWSIECSTGQPCTSVSVDAGDGSAPAILTLKSTWKGVAMEEREPLALALGSRFGSVLKLDVKVSLKKGVDCASLRAIVGDEAYEKLCAVLEVSASLAPVPEAWDRERARAAAAGDEAALAAFIGVDNSRSVYFKAN